MNFNQVLHIYFEKNQKGIEKGYYTNSIPFSLVSI